MIDLSSLGPICDSSMHVYEDGRRLAPTATIVPPHAPLAAYEAVQRDLGLSRTVVSQPTAYAFDNSLVLETLARIGANGRGVAVVPADVDAGTLKSMHDRGVRSVRFMMYPGGVLGWDALVPLAEKVAPLGWSLKFQLPGDRFDEYAPVLASLPTDSIVDFNPATFAPTTDADGAALSALRRLLGGGRCWVSLCAPYSPSDREASAQSRFLSLARQLLTDNPQRCVWASHWPYLGITPVPGPRDGLDWLRQLTADRPELTAVLVDNPALLFDF